MGRLKRFWERLNHDPGRRIVTLSVFVSGHGEFHYDMMIFKAEAFANQCMKNGLYVHNKKTWFPPHRIVDIIWSEKDVPHSNLATTKA